MAYRLICTIEEPCLQIVTDRSEAHLRCATLMDKWTSPEREVPRALGVYDEHRWNSCAMRHVIDAGCLQNYGGSINHLRRIALD